MKNRIKASTIAVRTTLYLISTVLIFSSIELGARFIEYFGPKTFVFKKFDSDLGVSLLPNKSGIHRSCFDGYVVTNSDGMRDKERTEQRPNGVFRIGIFGDSVMEGLHVYPDQVAARRLEFNLNRELCDGKCEVLNFSTGGYGTVEEYIKYTKVGRKFDINLGIVAFTGNDLSNNLPDSMIYDGNLYGSVQVKKTQEGDYEYVRPKKPRFYDLLFLLNDNSVAFRFLYKFYIHVAAKVLSGNLEAEIRDTRLRFLDPRDQLGQTAWEITDSFLSRFAEDLRANGADMFLVYSGYDVYQETQDWKGARQQYVDRVGRVIDATYASKWLAEWGRGNGVRTFDLGQHLYKYLKSNNLKDVGLGYSCDTHLNPEGHKVVAEVLFDAIKGSGVLIALGRLAE